MANRNFPHDERLVYGELSPGCFLSFVPCGVGGDDYSKGINIHEEYYERMLLGMAIGKAIIEFSMYDTERRISFKEWGQAMRNWRRIIEAEHLDDIFEWLCDIDYATHSIGDRNSLWRINHLSQSDWQRRKSDQSLYEDILEWFEMVRDGYTYITFYGI